MIEVFNQVSRRQVQALMFHEQMADYFDFLSLGGIKRWHEHQYIAESCEMRGIHRYAINHLGKIINDGQISGTDYIPKSWYNYNRKDVDTNTRKQAVREAFEKWVAWETETKTLYQNWFKTLTDNAKIAEADKINCLICDVDKELKCVERKMLEYKAVDYDMSYVVYDQKEMHDHYEKKLAEEYKVKMC